MSVRWYIWNFVDNVIFLQRKFTFASDKWLWQEHYLSQILFYSIMYSDGSELGFCFWGLLYFISCLQCLLGCSPYMSQSTPLVFVKPSFPWWSSDPIFLSPWSLDSFQRHAQHLRLSAGTLFKNDQSPVREKQPSLPDSPFWTSFSFHILAPQFLIVSLGIWCLKNIFFMFNLAFLALLRG